MLFLIILLANFLLRLQRFDFPASYTFAWGDGTRDYLVANHILRFHEFPLTGPFNLLNPVGILSSPIYFYILSLFLIPFNNILTLSFINIFLQLGVIILIYKIAKKLFDYPTALIAVLLFSFNPEIIKQADFVWQPYLAYPFALLGLYFNVSRPLVSLSLISFATTLHYSAFPWLLLFVERLFFFRKKSHKFYVIALFITFSTLALLYLPHIFVGLPIYVSSLTGYFSNLGLNIRQLLNAFYLNNMLAIFLIIGFLVTLKKDLEQRKSLIFLFLLFISPIIFASFFNKFRLHYLILCLGVLPILTAKITSIFKPALRFTVVIILIFIFSGNFAYFRDFKKPLQNRERIERISSVIFGELNRIKKTENYIDFDFFQVMSFAVSEVTIPYPVLDTFLLVPLEEKLGRKLARVSDISPYNHLQIGKKDYLFVSCFKFSKDGHDCAGYFKSSFQDYDILKMIYNDESLSIYLAKNVPLSTSFVHSQTAIIEMTADGFTPADVTIDSNSAVIFINKDNIGHWPASNPHPVHDLYPEFDPQMPIEPGKSWAFRPKKVGDWKYHDHLNPHRGGLIKVIPEKGQVLVTQSNERPGFAWIQNIRDFLTKIFSAKMKDKFTKAQPSDQFDQLKKYADSQGAEKAWQFIKETFKDQSGSSGNIHDLAHLAGGLLFEKLKFAGLAKCTTQFAFGCYHGFLDKAFAKSIDKLQEAEDACRKLDLKLSGPVASCIHGIGHGVASFYSVSDLNKALSTCRKLTAGSEYCFDGVLMEFARSAPETFYKKNDPLYPCDELEKEFGYAYSSACGRNQPSVLMGRFKMDFAEVVPVCLNSSSEPFKEACTDSLGFSLAATGDVGKIIQGCQVFMQIDYIKRCIKAAAGELVFQEVPRWDEKSKAVCLSFQDATDCLAYVERLVSDYHRVRK